MQITTALWISWHPDGGRRLSDVHGHNNYRSLSQKRRKLKIARLGMRFSIRRSRILPNSRNPAGLG